MSSRPQKTLTETYIETVFAPEDDMLREVAQVGESLQPGMQVSAAEGKLLHCLLRMTGAKRVLEFGTFVGYSAIWMARALPHDGELITLEKNSDYAERARQHAQRSALPIRIMQADAMESLARLTGSFDAVFIDGEKRSYMRYLNAALPLLRSGGLVMADNTLLFGALTGQPQTKISDEARQVMQDFNARMANSAELTGIMIPTREGLTVAIKK